MSTLLSKEIWPQGCGSHLALEAHVCGVLCCGVLCGAVLRGQSSQGLTPQKTPQNEASCLIYFRLVGCMLRRVAVCRSVLQCVAVCCSVLQCVAVYCSVLQSVYPSGSVSTRSVFILDQWGLCCICCIVLQCVAMCCSVLQCVAVCCSVLRCVAVYVPIGVGFKDVAHLFFDAIVYLIPLQRYRHHLQ